MAGLADHVALTERARLESRMPFLKREGASVGGARIIKDVVSLVIRSQGRRVRALPTAMPVDRCSVYAMAFWRRAGSEGRAEAETRFIRRESEVGTGQNASYVLFAGAMRWWAAFARSPQYGA